MELDAAYSGIADGFGGIVVVVEPAVVDIDSYYFRHFRCHPCTMAIAAAVVDSQASSWRLKLLTSKMTKATSRVMTRAGVERAACIYGTINLLHLFRSRHHIDRDRL